MSEGIAQMIAEGRADRQFALVREHWAAVRRLWLGASERPDVGTFRSNLPVDFWIGCGMPGLATVAESGHRFQFAEGGAPAIIIPCYDTIPGNLDANPAAHVEHLVDLVGIDVDHPDRFWRRRGKALVLGNAYLEIAGQEGEPVPVFRNPLTWLRSGGAGIVILDWDCAWDLLLGFELIAEDVELGNRLETVLRPGIWVMEAAV